MQYEKVLIDLCKNFKYRKMSFYYLKIGVLGEQAIEFCLDVERLLTHRLHIFLGALAFCK